MDKYYTGLFYSFVVIHKVFIVAAPIESSRNISQDAYSSALRLAWCNLNNFWEEIRGLKEGLGGGSNFVWFCTFLVIIARIIHMISASSL